MTFLHCAMFILHHTCEILFIVFHELFIVYLKILLYDYHSDELNHFFPTKISKEYIKNAMNYKQEYFL